MSKYGLKRLFVLLLIPFTVIILWIVPKNPEFVEFVFSRGIYRTISLFFNQLTGRLKFSIASVLYPLAFLILLIKVFLFSKKYIKAKKAKKEEELPSVYKFLINIFIVAGIVVFVFVFSFSLNYYRVPFAEQIGLETFETTTDVLYEVTLDIADKANTYRRTMKQNDAAVAVLTRDFYETGRAAQKAINNLSEEYPVLAGNYSLPKPVIYSSLMSSAGITGVFTPITFEANINTDAPEYTIPSTMCHELAHLRGFMSEDEANFISYLACIKSNDVEFNYSGYIMALTYCLNSLYTNDTDKYYEIKENLSYQIKRDLEYSVKYWAQHQGGLSDISEALNDTYLKANNQPDGIGSYGMVVDLIIAYHLSQK